jgi:hypothetical protein
MSREVRVPGVLDLLVAEEPEAVRALAGDLRLDRDYGRAGPIANRLAAGHVRDALRHAGSPLPAVAPRGTPGRDAARAALESRLASAATDQLHLDLLARHVRGDRDAPPLGPLLQEAVGRLFVPGYTATAETWQAALFLDRAVRSQNPLRNLLWRLGARIDVARSRLASACGGDLAGLHATGIAVHNLVAAIGRMQALAGQPGVLARTPPERAAITCLVAPAEVLREAIGHGATPHGSFRPGTLVLLRLETARARALSSDLAFLSMSWSRCPAHAWVPGLLAAVWARAQEPAA